MKKCFAGFLTHRNPNDCAAQLLFNRGISCKIFVKGVSFSTTEETLASAFSQFGKILEAKLIMNKANNRPKGFGYVTFATEDEAQKAVTDMNGKLLDGRVLLVDEARPSQHSEDNTTKAKRTSKPAADT